MIFEDLLMEIQSDLVSLGLEYSNSQIDEIYLYGYIEEGSYFFNLFFKKNGKIIRLNQINDFLSENEKIDDSRDRQIQLLELGIDDLEKSRFCLRIIKKKYLPKSKLFIIRAAIVSNLNIVIHLFQMILQN